MTGHRRVGDRADQRHLDAAREDSPEAALALAAGVVGVPFCVLDII
ncbi:hypothetical protein [Streptomyces mirabilis]